MPREGDGKKKKKKREKKREKGRTARCVRSKLEKASSGSKFGTKANEQDLETIEVLSLS